jgi:hypothetical protein
MTPNEVTTILRALRACFPNFRPDRDAVLGWTNALSPLDRVDADAATMLLCRGQIPEISAEFVPTAAVFFRIAERVRKERYDVEESRRRRETPKIEKTVEAGRSARSVEGAAIREALARDVRLTDILTGIGRETSGPPTTKELNERKNRFLDALKNLPPPKPLTLNEDDFKAMGGGA